MALPALTPEQRKEAQAASLRVRKARSELLDKVTNGEVTVVQFLDDGKGDPVPGRTRVLALVKAVPGIGAVKAPQLLKKARIPEDKRVKSLGDRQRLELLKQLQPTP